MRIYRWCDVIFYFHIHTNRSNDRHVQSYRPVYNDDTNDADNVLTDIHGDNPVRVDTMSDASSDVVDS